MINFFEGFKKYIIIAPHPDDSIIGCYRIVKSYNPIIINIGADLTVKQKENAIKLGEHFDIKGQLFLQNIPNNLLSVDNLFFFPDPKNEIHHMHRLYGGIGESLARMGMNVVFYTTNMNTSYIHEVENPDEKKEALNKIYPDQSDLWKYDHKYFLFEGYTTWLFDAPKIMPDPQGPLIAYAESEDESKVEIEKEK